MLEQEGSGTRRGVGLVGTFGAKRTVMGPLELVVWRGGACLTFHVDVNHLLVAATSVELFERVIDPEHFATRGEGGRNVRCWQAGPGRLRRHGSETEPLFPHTPKPPRALKTWTKENWILFLPTLPSWTSQDSFFF